MLQRQMDDRMAALNLYREMNPEAHDIVQIGDSFSVELIRVNHSIPDATAVVVRTLCAIS